jgi:hypothetical protein
VQQAAAPPQSLEFLFWGAGIAGIISKMAPGTSVDLDTWRDGEAMQVKLMLGSAQCQTSG